MPDPIPSLQSKPPAPGRRVAIVLAVAVHLALALFLIYGVRWQSLRPEAVAVDLVRATPDTPAAAAAAPEPKIEPPPEPKLEPKPAPAPEPKPAPKPDIALKAEPKPPPPPPPPKADAYQRALDEDLKKLDTRRNEAAASAELSKVQAQLGAATRDKLSRLWQDKIAAKIKGNIVRPASANGNPEAVFEVTLLPDGSLVGDPRLKKSTGNPALDAAIERAIRKSDPLPKPDDAGIFQRVLLLTFRPLEM